MRDRDRYTDRHTDRHKDRYADRQNRYVTVCERHERIFRMSLASVASGLNGCLAKPYLGLSLVSDYSLFLCLVLIHHRSGFVKWVTASKCFVCFVFFKLVQWRGSHQFFWAGSTICEALGYLGSEAPSPGAKPTPPPSLKHIHYENKLFSTGYCFIGSSPKGPVFYRTQE